MTENNPYGLGGGKGTAPVGGGTAPSPAPKPPPTTAPSGGGAVSSSATTAATNATPAAPAGGTGSPAGGGGISPDFHPTLQVWTTDDAGNGVSGVLVQWNVQYASGSNAGTTVDQGYGTSDARGSYVALMSKVPFDETVEYNLGVITTYPGSTARPATIYKETGRDLNLGVAVGIAPTTTPENSGSYPPQSPNPQVYYIVQMLNHEGAYAAGYPVTWTLFDASYNVLDKGVGVTTPDGTYAYTGVATMPPTGNVVFSTVVRYPLAWMPYTFSFTLPVSAVYPKAEAVPVFTLPRGGAAFNPIQAVHDFIWRLLGTVG